MLTRGALHWATTAIVGAACAGATYLWLPPRVSASGAASDAVVAEKRTSGAAASGDSARKDPSGGDDVAATRQAVVAALLQVRDHAPGAVAEPGAVEPSAKARETLDQRMAEAAPDAANTTRMEQAIEAVLASGVLGATSAEKACGATLCRVDLANDDAPQLNQAINALSERIPKLFVRSLVIPSRNGERAFYLTTDSRALDLAPASEREIVIAAPESAPK